MFNIALALVLSWDDDGQTVFLAKPVGGTADIVITPLVGMIMLTTLLVLACNFLNFAAVAKGLTTGTAMAAFMLCLAYFIEWRKST